MSSFILFRHVDFSGYNIFRGNCNLGVYTPAYMYYTIKGVCTRAAHQGLA